MNKTKKYLMPVLLSYGQEFNDWMVSKVFKLAVGIGDVITLRSNITLDKHLFILIDTKKSADFAGFINWLKHEPMYEEDYAFDDLVTGHLHMIVIKFPPQYYHVLETFKKSEYSKMYTKEEIKQFFRDTDAIKVLVKDSSYRVTFSDKIYEAFNVRVKPDEMTGYGEFDFHVDEQEVFNSHLFTGARE